MSNACVCNTNYMIITCLMSVSVYAELRVESHYTKLLDQEISLGKHNTL